MLGRLECLFFRRCDQRASGRLCGSLAAILRPRGKGGVWHVQNYVGPRDADRILGSETKPAGSPSGFRLLGSASRMRRSQRALCHKAAHTWPAPARSQARATAC